jgi:hypothetical protein
MLPTNLLNVRLTHYQLYLCSCSQNTSGTCNHDWGLELLRYFYVQLVLTASIRPTFSPTIGGGLTRPAHLTSSNTLSTHSSWLQRCPATFVCWKSLRRARRAWVQVKRSRIPLFLAFFVLMPYFAVMQKLVHMGLLMATT